jgi:hypothetical protein
MSEKWSGYDDLENERKAYKQGWDDAIEKYEKLKEFVRGKWKGDCVECATIANSILNQENASRESLDTK